MTAETLANEHATTPDSDGGYQLQTREQNGNTVTLRDSVEVALSNYFEQLDGAPVTEVYQLVLSEVEAPLLEHVMQYTRNNQTKASTMLGLNRGTLRKKLKQYGLL
ncbi:MAG: DNA-binding transcriptional regulator Fis [Alteromonadaceae bacterium]|uniref:DNA-binding transcriptional regulator Fis n=1 Tax=unclassified Marinobacter TaxID=83889 RepID=UPI000C6ACE2B|nr:DNA-binding transcriptional regulator Fis [Marinobacter sp. BGYM27]MAA67123.1 DNA-binding transcriptional regulator Fis [Alteromonadaceae bacterium]MBH87014.1 DNA-binding transcriptional regulator Fis [Alteromonadaceae bacterium]MDG5500916.1 DNA-binding transcriptional regulator Fis [Marinobacter sp. BGYM27]|tara:strand:- start:11122 stop:11439 length:318 start_codon:yes stop_codon:yes gene_type:complete